MLAVHRFESHSRRPSIMGDSRKLSDSTADRSLSSSLSASADSSNNSATPASSLRKISDALGISKSSLYLLSLSSLFVFFILDEEE